MLPRRPPPSSPALSRHPFSPRLLVPHSTPLTRAHAPSAARNYLPDAPAGTVPSTPAPIHPPCTANTAPYAAPPSHHHPARCNKASNCNALASLPDRSPASTETLSLPPHISSAKSKSVPTHSTRRGRANIAAARSAISQSLHRTSHLLSTRVHKNNSHAPAPASTPAPCPAPAPRRNCRLPVPARAPYLPTHQDSADPPASLSQTPAPHFANPPAKIIQSHSRSTASNLPSPPQSAAQARALSSQSRAALSYPAPPP